MADPLSSSTKARMLGALPLGAGLLLVKITVIDVLANARAHGPVTTYIKGTVVAPLFIAVGLLALIIGAPREPKPGSLVLYFITGHGPNSRLKPPGYVLVAIMIGVGLALHGWVNGELRALGYE